MKHLINQQGLDWNTKLAIGNGKFRRVGAYNTFASGRQLRRINERQAAKAAAKVGGAK